MAGATRTGRIRRRRITDFRNRWQTFPASHEKRDGVRAGIRVAARERSLRDHTWSQRFDQIFERLGIKKG